MEIERGVGPEWSRAHAQLLMDQGRWAFNADGFQHWSSELFEIHWLFMVIHIKTFLLAEVLQISLLFQILKTYFQLRKS